MKLKASDLKNVQRQTNLDKVEIKDVYNVFLKVAPNGAVDRAQFKESLEILEESGLKRIARTPYAERLFTLLDKNGDGVVDFKEFVSGFALLCKGTAEDKIRYSFSAYDKDGNGQISRPELEEMFKSAWMAGFKTMSSTDLDESELSVQEINDFCEDCAKTFASNVLEQMDTDGDGQLSYDEFKEFALQEPKITACLNDFETQISIMF
eukprot:CAMPEP_0114632040 /NCGR_PEP_ID=MMETSP0168-20121206/14724_1 /TAXON_ID=95228 ORGANISM="Vannella sp., Strain DIVA3 517/6/12" /NCGR_SAMPLE_ID=MMETSP0168 /ASSEMBLY_ACC=CAM_ASM_000044 /LENGTH=207 /DNA_ID=CAMNT_0001843627 /DNA_START=64 /DNA_END=687 /DNA_ORIENTATION=-